MEWRLLLMSFGAFSNVESGFIVAFYALRRRSLAPEQMAIFTRKDFHARMVEMYFSPAASHLGAMAGAAPCSRPARQPGMQILAGAPDAWALMR